ncbi:putative translocase [Helianthus annuus]|nr:putative translocase [Helianthus annuus]KAJ0508906.1 putative translocase [Helianthus annuus]KAJ0517077.1 putative translocase [Helianthus annuus]KAJ0685086.1 putative translocase [Helianthus annuus]KAJ0689003.1 putative translocase [Helianthus annuus]
MEGTLTGTTTLLFFSKTLPRCSQIYRTQLPVRRTTTTANDAFLRPLRKLGSKSPLFERVSPVSAGGIDDASPSSSSSSDVIVLDVRGMMCDGCASSVKRILENQSQVSSANVDHKTETAIVWPVPEAKDTPGWQKVIGEEIAKNLTNCGFDSNLRGEAAA